MLMTEVRPSAKKPFAITWEGVVRNKYTWFYCNDNIWMIETIRNRVHVWKLDTLVGSKSFFIFKIYKTHRN